MYRTRAGAARADGGAPIAGPAVGAEVRGGRGVGSGAAAAARRAAEQWGSKCSISP